LTGETGPKKLGEILIEQGVLTPENLEKALEVQKTESGLLGEILIRLKMLKEEDVVIALATQFNFPYLAVQSFTINPEAIRCVPQELAVEYTFIPIDKVHNILTVVMADPSNQEVIRQIESATACRVQAFVGTVSEIEEAVKRNYKLSDFKKTKSERRKVKMAFKSTAEQKIKREEETA